MRVLRAVPNVPSKDLSRSRRFCGGTLGYRGVMDLGWTLTFASPTDPATQIISRDPSGLHPNVSIEVDDVDAAHAEMRRQNFEVVYPPGTRPGTFGASSCATRTARWSTS
ncbi:hypothetical protein DAERI_010384 [Deinococcus aerius]|uniref:Glyoxalase/bleomycin resistance protein/dioxygenase n=1 Tax=Deinococcus aerius TaxID=200253 RepID=A0A2I9CRM6_9DEIO|nr:glyoxalase [Deinococcus aerius]GBF04212.1 hypothetical protein DAERI_010384 [Deinococcus aerius]